MIGSSPDCHGYLFPQGPSSHLISPTRKPQGPTTDTQFLPKLQPAGVLLEKQKEEG